MEDNVASLGIRDKVYWRFGAAPTEIGKFSWHAFVKASAVFGSLARDEWRSLCGRHVIDGPGLGGGRGGGQKINRPAVALRCPECDEAEIKFRRASASLPPSAGREAR